MIERVVLAYSGGRRSSVALARLREHYGAEVVAVTLHLGQDGSQLHEARDRALAAGAVRAHVLDVREEFARNYVLPALQAGALFDDGCPLATALGRPLIATTLVDVARIERTAVVAHGCLAGGRDAGRIEAAARALDRAIRILAPCREAATPRQSEGHGSGAAEAATPVGSYAADANLWGRSVEYAPFGSSGDAPEGVDAAESPPAGVPVTPAYVEITFDRGVPVAINGVPMMLTELIDSLSIIAGPHGVGRSDVLESQPGGVEVRRISEAPAAVVLHAAHRDLEASVAPVELVRLKRELGVKYAELVDSGGWCTMTRQALDAFNSTIQARVTGVVRVKLFKGHHTAVGRQSPNAPGGADTGARARVETVAGTPEPVDA